MIYTAVIADDITGANDIGIMYAKAGLDAVVYSYDRLTEPFVPEHEVTIIDTNSRFCTYQEAYARVYRAVSLIGKQGAVQFVNKQCSVFRGNIGAEFDAMLDALSEEHAMVVLGFPDNGRTTMNGIHSVYGVLLAQSQFRADPVHPMTDSNLVEILSSQTKRKVRLISYEVLDLGEEAVRLRIKQLKKEASYLIFDVRDNQDLMLLARVLQEEKVICGSSAPGYYLGSLYAAENGISRKDFGAAATEEKILCIAGSLTPQTRAQTAYMRAQGYPVITLATEKLLCEAEREIELARIENAYGELVLKKRLLMIHSMQEPEQVRRTKEAAAAHGIDNTQVSELVSGALAQLAKKLAEKYQIRRFIICGGDTSASFCREMNVQGMKVLREIEAGLPMCQSLTPPYYELVLKSGSFGSETFIETAMQYL